MPTPNYINTREELIAALCEAAEIEHGLLLQYLFAALTMKQSPDEDVKPEHFAKLRIWKGILLGVAVEEMGHLGTVSNLLAAIGATPHFERPEFPQATGYYPFPFELIPFSDDALKRFVTAELPRGGKIDDCLKDGDLASAEHLFALHIAPEIPNYTYVGELYDCIASGFNNIPENSLFIGNPTRQVDNEWSINVDMKVITGRASALDAIADIVHDGEGTPSHRVNSHYGRFCRVWKEFRADPFEAARPVVRNPRTRNLRTNSTVPISLITDEISLAVAELFNQVYALMLRLLAQFFSNSGESTVQRDAIRSATARLMSVAIRPISEVLTSLPATSDGVGNAGPSFELYLPLMIPPEPKNRWVMLFESFDVLIGEASRLGSEKESLNRLVGIADTLRIMKRFLQDVARSKE